MRTKHTQNEKQFNSTIRNNKKRRVRAIYYWYKWTYHVRLAACLTFLHRIVHYYSHFPCYIRSSPAEVKQNNHNLASYLHKGRAKNLGLLGQSLLTKLAIIYVVALRLVICIMYVIYFFLCVCERCPSKIA